MTRTRSASWSDIPLELAGLVLLRLPANVDRVRFAAVCPQWRAATRVVPLPPPLPLLALPDGTVYSFPASEPLRFPACAGYADACGNLLAFSPGEDDGCCFLRDPFSNATVMLPDLFRVRAGDYVQAGLLLDLFPYDEETGVRWMEMEERPELVTMYKLLFCSPQLIATFVRFQESTRVAVCKPGASSWWSVHMNHPFPLFVDMAFHQGKLYVLDHLKDTLFAIDICVDRITGDPWVSRVKRAIVSIPHLPTTILRPENVIVEMLYLVELHGAMLMVFRKMHCKLMKVPTRPVRSTLVSTGVNEFEVFKADFQRSQWTKVTTIGDDQVLFLRRRCSRSVSVSRSEMPGDCIVFFENDDEDLDWFDEESSDSCRVYDMKDGKVSIAPTAVSWKCGFVPATWLFPEN